MIDFVILSQFISDPGSATDIPEFTDWLFNLLQGLLKRWLELLNILIFIFTHGLFSIENLQSNLQFRLINDLTVLSDIL